MGHITIGRKIYDRDGRFRGTIIDCWFDLDNQKHFVKVRCPDGFIWTPCRNVITEQYYIKEE